MISFPWLLRWFTSPCLAPPGYTFTGAVYAMGIRVAPFGYPGVDGCSLLAPDFRGLPRPSSPCGSKASAVDLFSLDHIAVRSCRHSNAKPPPSGQARGSPLARGRTLSRHMPVPLLFPSLLTVKKIACARPGGRKAPPPAGKGRKEIPACTARTQCHRPFTVKGGDPAAPSGTTTLLRLHPPHEAHLGQRPPLGWTAGFGCPPLGWCDGRCVQGPGTYSPRRADARLLAIPASRSRVSDSDPDYDGFSAFRSASRPRLALCPPL